MMKVQIPLDLIAKIPTHFATVMKKGNLLKYYAKTCK